MDKTSTHIIIIRGKTVVLFRRGSLYKNRLPLPFHFIVFFQWLPLFTVPSLSLLSGQPPSARPSRGRVRPWSRRRPPPRRVGRRGCGSAVRCRLAVRRFTRCLGFRWLLPAGRSRRLTGNWRGLVIRTWWRRIRPTSSLRFRRLIRHCRIRIKGRITTGRFTELNCFRFRVCRLGRWCRVTPATTLGGFGNPTNVGNEIRLEPNWNVMRT